MKLFYSLALGVLVAVAFAASAFAHSYIAPRPMFAPPVVYHDDGHHRQYAPRRHRGDAYYNQRSQYRANQYYSRQQTTRQGSYAARSATPASRYTAPAVNPNRARQWSACNEQAAKRRALGLDSRPFWHSPNGCTAPGGIVETGRL